MIDISKFQSVDLSFINGEAVTVHKEGFLKMSVVNDHSMYMSTVDICRNNKLLISIVY